MPEEKRLPDLTLGKRFPRRLLNFLPKAWRREHLAQKSGGAGEPEEFSFTDHFRGAGKLVLAWPERSEEILIAFPAARALFDTLPAETECLHLCEAGTSALVQDLFPGAVLEWKESELAWHEAEIQSLAGSLRGFRPDTVLILSQAPYPTVLQAALRTSRARVRIGWESAVGAPFANARLRAEESTPLAARYFQCLNLWRYAGFSPREDWTRIQSDTDRRLAAQDLWSHKRATPENTWLYVHDAASGRPLDDALFAALEEKIAAREVPGFTLGAALWNPGGREIAREGAWRDAPVFDESDLPGLLAVLECARGAIAYQGFGLHFASLVEVRCLGLLKPEEAVYDASGSNPLFEVEWI